jgi:hypothetical protein
MQQMNKFKVGDRVIRNKGQVDERRGVVTVVYSSMPNHEGKKNTLYQIRWETQPQVGYLEIGLEHEETSNNN